MLRHLLSGVVIVAASVSPVLAADLIIDEEEVIVPVEDVFDWTGFYIGGHIGFGHGVVVHEFDEEPTDGIFVLEDDISASGFLLGAQAGALFQADMFVLGVEGRVSWNNISGDDANSFGDLDTFDAHWSASLLGSAGVAFDRFVPYLTAGVTALNYDYTVAVAPDSETFNATTWGPTFGAGVRFGLTDNVHIFGEWNRTWYHTTEFDFTGVGATFDQDVRVTPTVDTFLAGINVSFN